MIKKKKKNFIKKKGKTGRTSDERLRIVGRPFVSLHDILGHMCFANVSSSR
jgi:hypothetical protein